MAVRLQMKLGVVAEQDRLPDSPDTVVVVEPSVGSVARSKGHLYLLVTSRLPGHRAHEATRLAAETIRNEYYYDESAGIRVCIEKAIALANKRLGHQRDRLGLGHGDTSGPIGVGVAVVRGNELYVATVGPAEAYLIRQARLSTLPDPHRDRGLPATELEPDVWRGEIAVGDSLVLISPNVVARLGPEELKDAMVTLHPQSAMEHLHHRFVAADGSGSDGAVAFEATEVATTHKQRTLVPVRPPEPLAGAPDRSPIPLADPVVGGVAAVQAGARQARAVAGTAVERAILRLQDVLPRRRTTPHRRVTPATQRRETQRRAAMAILAFIVVAFGLGLAVFLAPRAQDPGEVISSVTAGQRALDTARANLARVFGPGVDLVERNPDQAHELLTEAYEELERAGQAGIAERTIRPIREDVVEGLDRLYGMITVDDIPVFAFDPVEPPVDLATLVRGPDLGPYVLDRGTKTVWRVNLREKLATVVIREGTEAAGAVAAEPRFLAVGGPDLLILDANNVLWRWRPADDEGRGTTTRVRVDGAAEWGDDIVGLGTYLRDAERGLYNLYLVDPSLNQILSYSPAADGGGFPAAAGANRWLNSTRDVSGVTALYIDGDVYLASGGQVARFSGGAADRWKPSEPGDDLLRTPPSYSLLASTTGRREGRIYAYDRPNARVLAFDKADPDGRFIEQYRLPEGNELWSDLRAMYVAQGAEGPPTLVWITADEIHFSRLAPAAATPSPSPGGSGPAPSPGGSPAGSPAASP